MKAIDLTVVETTEGQHIFADYQLLDFGLHGRASKQMVQLATLFR